MFKKTLLAAALLGCGAANAFMPQNGLWAVPAEIDGKPGRGFIVDVQNDTMFLTVFTYEQDGRPVFYTAAGEVKADGNGQYVFTAPLEYSQGGPGLAATGQITNGETVAARSPGEVTLRFSSTGAGRIRFPGASQDLQVARFNYGYEAKADSLLGSWTWGHPHGNHSHFWNADFVQKAPATATGNGVVQRANGLHGCEYQTSGAYANRLLCVTIGAETDGVRNVDVGNFAHGPNETDGLHRRIRGWRVDNANADADVNPEPAANPAFARRLQALDALPDLYEGDNPTAREVSERSAVHEVIDWVVARPNFFNPPTEVVPSSN